MPATRPHPQRNPLRQLVRHGACLLATLWLGASGTTLASESTDALENTARAWLKPTLDAQLPQDAELPLRTEVVMGSLDSRLRLAPCAKVEPHLPPGSRLWGRSRIGLRCVDGPRRWNVYIPVTIKAWGPAWVLRRPVDAGATLSQDDAEQVEVDWAAQSSAVLARPDMWVGQQTAFALTPGQAIRENMVRPTKAFAAGDQVRVNGSGTGFSISATGKALTHGLVGQSARIRLPGGRVVTGEVQDDQTVEMAL
ncbi:MAG: flagellar basal body P-ring formation chaperone FlgA [Hydrogenophaga sp.]|jgi:flagellar basal body P-ring formation protein FlgA|uniref:flagellar basal body P-ring formation chaperone FlgA n=1 Tax=Hydrogenophaga sp. TaxID=1904254 RepID=UPI0026398E96|nr:flagellar basal body P-ring formation chaperone FlgA [Hydrogenophaga sp.]MCV0441375.1 flagellar basal body P-ring formation chaperone FlgA [Hydrogenophaga sp.]